MAEQEKSIESIYPLSPMQQGMLFHTLLTPKSGVYFNQILYTLTGELQKAAMQRAWQQVVDRHEPLRTLFVWEGQEKLLQVVRRRVMLPWEELDWRGFSADEQSAKLAAFLQADRQRGFDLAQAPLMRLALIRLEESHYELIWSHHHLLMDGWSSFLILKDVRAIYQALSEGRDYRLEPLRPYRDYINWLQGQDLSKAEGFWRAALKGFAVPTPLLGSPVDVRHEDRDSATADLHGNSSPSLMAALRSFARRHDLTLSTIIHGAWGMLLSRYSGEGDVVFGSTVSGRPAELAGVESMVGLFINTLPVRAQFSLDDTVVSWLKEFQSKLVELRQYEHSPLVDVQGWSEVHRDQPLFESLLVFENYPVDASVWSQDGNLQFSNMRVVGPDNYALSVVVVPRKELAIRVNYDPRRFDAAAITRMLGHFSTLLEGIVANPDQRLSELPLLTSAERQQLLVDWNRTEVAYPKDRCLHELVEEQVERTPAAVAVVFENKHLTYCQLNERANQLAHYLQKLGVGPDTLVGICVERSLEMVVGLLGILKAGGAYVPLDPEYPKERLAFMLEDAAVPVLLTQAHLTASLPTHQARVVRLDADWPLIAEESIGNVTSSVRAEHLAYMIYTSGSTGRPKGAMIPHRAIVNHMRWMQATSPLDDRDSVLQKTPFSFDAAVWEFYAPLFVGGRLVVAQPGGHVDTEYLVKTIRGQRVTILQVVPSLLRMLLETPEFEACDTLRRVFSGGEALTADLVKRFYETVNAELHNIYGPTEVTIDSVFFSVPYDYREKTVPIGRPVANTRAYILDSCLEPVAIGMTGELYLGGVQVGRGYHNRPELTAEKFIPDPFRTEPGARLYKTGDLARYLPDGAIEYLGRLDHQVKIRGFRIELGEIESVLAALPGVREAVVAVREDIAGDKRLVAYLTSRGGETLKDSELRGLLQAKLPDYMMPSAFVTLDRLPLTPNGKVDRKALPVPDRVRPEVESGFFAPRTSVEAVLADIWSQVLRIEQVGVHDRFFELGGDSILSIQVIARANKAGLRLTLKQIFQHQTIAELALVAEAVTQPRFEQGFVTGDVPLTPIQQWFFEQDYADRHHWNQARLLELRQDFEPSLLERAIQHLVVHHDALRLRFQLGDAGWRQFNAGSEEAVKLTLVDLAGTPEEKQTSVVETAAAGLQASLNLSQGPVIRAALFNFGSRRPSRLLLVIHHLAVDEVSWRILLEDLQLVCEQLQTGGTVKLPAKTTSFRKWAQELAEHAHSGTLEQEADYWLAVSSAESRPIPVDFSGGKNTAALVRTVSVSLDAEDTCALLQKVPQAYNTQINDVLLSALGLALTSWIGQPVARINLEGHGREELFEGIDLSRTVGWFTTIFPVKLDLRGTVGPGEVLKSVKEQLRRIPQRGIGYGMLRYLRGDEDVATQLRSAPQPEIIFNYLGQLDQAAPASPFGSLERSTGPSHSPLARRSHLLSINSLVIDGRLRLDWGYSEAVHRRSTIERLAQNFIEALRSLIHHCCSPSAGGYTPSDFVEAGLDQEGLDRLISELTEGAN